MASRISNEKCVTFPAIRADLAVGTLFAMLLLMLLATPVQAKSAGLMLKADNAPEALANVRAESSNDATIYARYRLGVEYFFQERYDDAVRILLPLARNGHASAQYYIGILYDQGGGVKKNRAQALYWYRRAAYQQHIGAQYNVGVAYANGEGVKADMQQAVVWWERAASRGNLDAQYNLGMLYMSGKGVRRSVETALKWWDKAARQGDKVAQYNLGVIYLNGDGVSRNVCKAVKYWQASARQGFRQAVIGMAVLKKNRMAESCMGKMVSL